MNDNSAIGVGIDVAETLQSLVDQAEEVAAMQRDPSVPEGTVLAEYDTGGLLHREVKQSSLVRMGKVPLPERFEAWGSDGSMSMLPTAQMNYMLAKPNAETGGRAFHVHRRGTSRDDCVICPPPRETYPGTCNWCLERSSGRVQKRFDSESAQEAHFEYYHAREWATLQRQIERAERQAEIQAQKELANAILASVQGGAASTAPRVFPCEEPGCERFFDSEDARGAHARHHGRR